MPAAMAQPVSQLTQRDHGDEDAADREHDEDGLLALLGCGLDGEQVKHGRNLSQRRMGGERLVHCRVADCLTRDRVE